LPAPSPTPTSTLSLPRRSSDLIIHHPASPRLVPGSGDTARETARSESSHPSRIRLALACLVAGLLNFCVLGILFLLTQHFQDVRSEEHTSELQSRFDLVCRLLL